MTSDYDASVIKRMGDMRANLKNLKMVVAALEPLGHWVGSP